MDKKQAFLVLAHKDDYTFRTLLRTLDNKDCTLFIHMDKKNKEYNPQAVEHCVSNATIVHTVRTDVKWGSFSQIRAEFVLLKAARSIGRFGHYHLISGEDLPICPINDIVRFFNEHDGVNFINFQSKRNDYYYRTRFYYLFPNKRYKGSDPLSILCRLTDDVFLRIQKIIGVSRNKEVFFTKGANWFSITDDLAKYVIENEAWVKKVFAYSLCGDEMFLQTLVYNSDFKNTLYLPSFDDDNIQNMRLVDWKRGNPYVFQREDLETIVHSDCLFARKFQCKVDSEIIDAVAKHCEQ